MKTMINETLDTVNTMEKYDAACKMLLSQKVILAHIIKHCIEEFYCVSVDEIVREYIEDDPKIDTEDVMPIIHGINPENVDIHEGRTTGDIRFCITTPQKKRWIIDVEAQRKFHPKYSLIQRGTYYLGRMISAQKGTEFTNDHYENLKKSFVIWICMEPPKEWSNAVTGYDVFEYHISGEGSLESEEYELMTQIIIGLGDSEDESAVGAIRLLDVIFSGRFDLEQKKKILSSEFDIAMTEEVEQGVKTVCNFSEAILERGLDHGIELMSQLTAKLISEERFEDLKRTTFDKEYREFLMSEYNLRRMN